jgi:ABC-2 type transport system permease protein
MTAYLADAWTVMRKELYELLAPRRRANGGIAIVAIVVVLMGVVLPLQVGPRWLDSPWLLQLWAWLPIFLAAIVITDSVAGERERHTLETLLASPLPDRAILLGKIGGAVLYGWGLVFLSVVASVLTISLIYPAQQIAFYTPVQMIGGGALSLLASVLAASFSVLVSLRANSLRQAQQIVVATLVLAFFLLVVALPLAMGSLPASWQFGAGAILSAFDDVQSLLAIALILAVSNAALLFVANLWFQRNRLHLH